MVTRDSDMDLMRVKPMPWRNRHAAGCRYVELQAGEFEWFPVVSCSLAHDPRPAPDIVSEQILRMWQSMPGGDVVDDAYVHRCPVVLQPGERVIPPPDRYSIDMASGHDTTVVMGWDGIKLYTVQEIARFFGVPWHMMGYPMVPGLLSLDLKIGGAPPHRPRRRRRRGAVGGRRW